MQYIIDLCIYKKVETVAAETKPDGSLVPATFKERLKKKVSFTLLAEAALTLSELKQKVRSKFNIDGSIIDTEKVFGKSVEISESTVSESHIEYIMILK